MQAVDVFQKPIVGFRDPNFFFNDLLDLVALNQAHRGLITSHPKIVTGDLMAKPRRGERQIPQQHQFLGQLRIAGNDHSAFAGGDNFVGVKAKTTHLAETAGHSIVTSCAVRFRAIFDHNQIVFSGDLAKAIHVHRMTKEMDRNDCAGARSD